MDTLLLDTQTWDLVYDANGNIAVAAEPYALAQDAASEIKTFLGECYYDTTRGVDYTHIFGRSPALTFIKGLFVAAASKVPDVTKAACFLSSLRGRVLTGQVQVTTKKGRVVPLNFSTTPPGPSPLPFGP